MEYRENNIQSASEKSRQAVLAMVASLRKPIENLDIVMEHTFPDNWALGDLEEFLTQVEKNPDVWTAEKVEAEFNSKVDRLSEPPYLARQTGKNHKK
jgi:hypothetical protein